MQIHREQIDTLAAYMRRLSEQYNISFHVAGLLEYAEVENHPFSFLSSYMIHRNPYCMFAKSNQHLWNRCIRSKQKILGKLSKAGGCVEGVCHCGVGECLAPIVCGGKVVGLLSAGDFRPDEDTLKKRLHVTATRYGFSEETLRQVYEENIPKRQELPKGLMEALGTLSLLFSFFVEDSELWPPEFVDSQRTRQWLMMQQVLEYLHLHYGKEIAITDIARFCNYSKSGLQHLFKQNTGMSIGSYLEAIRMKKARQLLCKTSLSIGQIAAHIGYRDPNYFSLVFSKVHKMSPSAYRSGGFHTGMTYENEPISNAQND